MLKLGSEGNGLGSVEIAGVRRDDQGPSSRSILDTAMWMLYGVYKMGLRKADWRLVWVGVL